MNDIIFIKNRTYIPNINLKLLKRYETQLPFIRLGTRNDGGYVICDNLVYDNFISGGISNDINFENDFVEKYKIKCHAFDPTINELPPNSNSNINFIKKYIGSENSETTSNLFEYIKPYNNVFIKMDIEEGEYEWIKAVDDEVLSKISQIVIEIHLNISNPPNQEKWNILNVLSKYHNLVHIHGNNCGEHILVNSLLLPETIECTYIHKKYFMSHKYATNNIPLIEDSSNCPNRPDYNLTYLNYL